jgi:hypothetical protein
MAISKLKREKEKKEKNGHKTGQRANIYRPRESLRFRWAAGFAWRTH